MSSLLNLHCLLRHFQSSRQERVLRIIQILFFLFHSENICCDPSLEPSQRDGSNDGSQHTF